jgi:hypothetical protein|tara:strand:- start:4071 stop:4976 length:906 start_codon:yes stop_codon:yes gene_type:complete
MLLNSRILTYNNLIVFSVLLSLAFFFNPTSLVNEHSKFFDIRLIVMFLIAEPHFAMTIPLLYGYKSLFKKNKLKFVYIPALIVLIMAPLFIYNFILFSIIFLVANVYHVNRQSVGFFKIYNKSKSEINDIYEILLHLSTITWLLLYIFKVNLKVELGVITLLICIFIMSLFQFYYYKKKFNFLTLTVISQGFFIFFPICLFDNLILAFAVGISIHYIQYLIISYPICTKSFGYPIIGLFLFLIVYSSLSTSALSGLLNHDRFALVILIPTMLQLLHFYYDSFIWRGSDPYIREVMKKSLNL